MRPFINQAIEVPVVRAGSLLAFKLHPQNPYLDGCMAHMTCGPLDLICLPADDPTPFPARL
eukprot:6540053-Prorocentrum_lima.AAC.1